MMGMEQPADPFPPDDFDAWAENYDKSVKSNRFPFTGYEQVLRRMVRLAAPRPGMKVLDLGTGSGNLAVHFARAGCLLWGCDFSEAMLKQARRKLPQGCFVQHDVRLPLPPELAGPFERIVSGYTFHHFPLEEKVRILTALRPHLTSGGNMLIGDIAFPHRLALELVKQESGEEWDEEHYWLADEALPALREAGVEARYKQVSPCAGIFLLP